MNTLQIRDGFRRLAIAGYHYTRPATERTVTYPALSQTLSQPDAPEDFRRAISLVLSPPDKITEAVQRSPDMAAAMATVDPATGKPFHAFLLHAQVNRHEGERLVTDDFVPEINGRPGYSRSTPADSASQLFVRRLYSPNLSEQNGAAFSIMLRASTMFARDGVMVGADCPLLALAGRAQSGGIIFDEMQIANRTFRITPPRLAGALRVLAIAADAENKENMPNAMSEIFSSEPSVGSHLQELLLARSYVANHQLPEAMKASQRIISQPFGDNKP